MEINTLVTLDNPYSSVSELYRRIRTNIEYASLDKKLKVINITSQMANEAKTTTACNLSIMYANKFEKTLLIDTDLRKPSIHHKLKIKNKFGLTDLMLDFANNDYDISNVDLTKYVQKITHENIVNSLDVLSAGSKVSNPAEFLGSNTFKELISNLSKYYDYIIIDTAPSGLLVDGLIVSSIADGTLFVMGYNRNKIDTTKNVLNKLKNAGANVIGGVMTRTPVKNDFYNKYYSEYSYYFNNKRDGEIDE